MSGPNADTSGTVTKNTSPIVGYLWSQVSGPNVSAIPDESSLTTEVNDLIEGTYIFQFLAIDSSGLTGVDTLSVTVKPPVIQISSLQPGNNPNEINYINSNIGHTDHTSPELNAGAWTWAGTPGELRAAFQFDLSSIPANATIISAKLSLYSNPTPINGSGTTANFGTNNAFFYPEDNFGMDREYFDVGNTTSDGNNRANSDTAHQCCLS